MIDMQEDEPPDRHHRRREDPDATCPNHPHSGINQLVQFAWSQGWFCGLYKGDRFIFCFPNGGDSGWVTVPMNADDDYIESLLRQFDKKGLKGLSV